VSDADGLDLVLALLRGERTPTTGVPRQRRRNRLPAARGLARLTARESETLTGLIEGESTKALAARLGVSPATARAHVQSVLNKLGVHSRLEAVARATMDVEPPIPARAS
jgi:two-component system nitrate/nitrite response regulator NarL